MSDQFSFWERDAFLKPTDVLIVGGGFAGLWSALALKEIEPLLSIRIVDSNPVIKSASTRNAGFACYGSLTELLADARSTGEEQMLQMVEMRCRGLEILTSTFNADEIDYFNFGGYELIEKGKFSDTNELDEHRVRLNGLLKPVTRQSATFVFAENKFGFQQVKWLMKNNAEGQLHSGKLVQALMKKLRALGVEILAGVKALKFDAENGLTVTTDLGADLQAKQVLICNNAFDSQLSSELCVIPARGQVLMTSPIADLPFKGTFHFDEGFYYFRNLGDRVLLGGARNKAFEEERTTDMSVSALLQDELEKFLREVVIPGKSFVIDYRWSGIMGMSESRLPVVQRLAPNVFSAVGLGGIGVAVAPMIGRKAAELMLGKA